MTWLLWLACGSDANTPVATDSPLDSVDSPADSPVDSDPPETCALPLEVSVGDTPTGWSVRLSADTALEVPVDDYTGGVSRSDAAVIRGQEVGGAVTSRVVDE